MSRACFPGDSPLVCFEAPSGDNTFDFFKIYVCATIRLREFFFNTFARVRLHDICFQVNTGIIRQICDSGLC